MADRRYSVPEIDRMRRALIRILLKVHGTSGCVPAAENQLRTYMLNGTDPEELEAKAAAMPPLGAGWYSPYLEDF